MKYFTFSELVNSPTADKLGIRNEPDKKQKKNLIYLVDRILDPLRTEYGKPIYVTSGFRCKELNTKIGGSRNSQHCEGRAADLVVGKGENLAVLFVLILYLDLPFDQLICEKGQWVHVSYKEGGVNRRQILAYDGKSYYEITREWLWSVICKEDLPVRKKSDELPPLGCDYK